MNKHQLLAGIREKLNGLPKNDIDKSLDFYEEMIQDRIEEGLTEEEAVAALGSMDDIVSQIFSEISPPQSSGVNEKAPKKIRVWEIVLLILGSPIWLSLLLSAFALVLTFYIVIWSMVLTLYSVNLSIALSGIFGLAASGVYLFSGSVYQSLCLFGVFLFCSGLSVLMFFGLWKITKGIIFISKKVMSWIINLFRPRKESIK